MAENTAAAGHQRAVSGYIGGSATTAHYEIVGSGMTGHAEAVQVTYDPSQVSYAQLMRVFFSVVHDPTELNYQGPDHGTKYRSAIYTTTRGQLQATTHYIAQLTKAGTFKAPIVTQVAMAKPNEMDWCTAPTCLECNGILVGEQRGSPGES